MKLRLVTSNLWEGKAKPEALARLIEAERPDVLALQELQPHQAEVVSELLPHGLLEPETGYDGMGIAVRAPARVERLPLRERDGRIARLDPEHWPGLDRPLEILNVHIHAPHSTWPWHSVARRRAQLRGVLRHLETSPDATRIVCGDFNATPAWPVYRRLAARLEDLAALHARRAGRRPLRTWGPWSGSPRLLRIDHVLGRGVEPLEIRVVPVEGTDHSAVVAVVEV